MSHILIKPPDFSVQIKKKYYTHPFSEYTFKLKKVLLIVSFLAIILSLYDLKITTIPWLNIDISENDPNLLAGVLALILIYFFVVFIINAFYDIQKWNLNIKKDKYDWAINKYKEIAQNIDEMKRSKEFKDIDKVIERVNYFGSFIERTGKTIRLASKSVIYSSVARHFIIDLVLPLILSIIGLILIGMSGIQIIMKLF